MIDHKVIRSKLSTLERSLQLFQDMNFMYRRLQRAVMEIM